MPIEGETSRLISADKVEGTPVVNAAGDNLGHISDIMIDKPSGRVAYAVLKYASTLGIGGKLFAVPWDVLKYDARRHGYFLDIAEERLKQAPSFDPGVPPDLADPALSRQVHEYYGSSADWYSL